MSLNNTESLLERHESTFIKGLLILLIVMGHNNYIMDSVGTGAWFKDWLYSFHVHAYLYLPFLYGIKLFSWKRIHNSTKRLIIPYIFFFCLLLLMHSLVMHSCDIPITVLAFISGSQLMLREAIGMEYLWFLPAMFTLLILKDTYDTYRLGKVILPIALLLFILGIFYIIRNSESKYFPMGLYYALMNFPLAIFFRIVLSKKFALSKSYSSLTLLSLLIAIISSIIWFQIHPLKYFYNLFVYLILPICIFPAIFFLSKSLNYNGKIYRIIMKLGDKSLGIYLISQLIFQSLNIFITRQQISNLGIGIASFIITMILSVLILSFIKRFMPKFYHTVLA